jgi:asparaginyl-tRNA synthetase
LKDPKNPDLLFEYGDDILELAERTMIDMMSDPVFLIKFPAEQKAFYVQKCPDDGRLTKSVDLLVPGVGEVVGGSMRMDKFEGLLLREFGLGGERLVRWILSIPHIRDICLYPRTMNWGTP